MAGVTAGANSENQLTPALLAVRELRHAWGARTVLDGVTIEVRRGEVFGLLGANGSGKSTALAIISGLVARQGGTVEFLGRPLVRTDRDFRKRLGVVFQSPSLDLKLTARENLELAAEIHGLRGGTARERIALQLDRAGLADRAGEVCGNFSGGMRRRLDIARALLPGPALLLMDEPTAGLDEASFRLMWERLNTMREGGSVTVIVATHRAEEAELCDRLAVLHNGKIIAVDTPAALRARVRGDVVKVEASDAETLAAEIREKFSLVCTTNGNAVFVESEKGHELIPRLVEAFPAGRFTSISLRRPSLADVFLKLTGAALGEMPTPLAEAA